MCNSGKKTAFRKSITVANALIALLIKTNVSKYGAIDDVVINHVYEVDEFLSYLRTSLKVKSYWMNFYAKSTAKKPYY